MCQFILDSVFLLVFGSHPKLIKTESVEECAASLFFKFLGKILEVQSRTLDFKGARVADRPKGHRRLRDQGAVTCAP